MELSEWNEFFPAMREMLVELLDAAGESRATFWKRTVDLLELAVQLVLAAVGFTAISTFAIGAVVVDDLVFPLAWILEAFGVRA